MKSKYSKEEKFQSVIRFITDSATCANYALNMPYTLLDASSTKTRSMKM